MSGFSRRIGSKLSSRQTSSGAPRAGLSGRALALHLLPQLLLLPIISNLIAGNALTIVATVAAYALLFGAARLMRQGIQFEDAYHAHKIAYAPSPRKLTASLLVSASVFVLAWLAAGEGLVMAIVYAFLAGLGSIMAYGLDPRGEKSIDQALADRAGIKTQDVIDTLNEAEEKIRAIELDANDIMNSELVQRLDKIAQSARRVLSQIEQDPADIRRARRFLVTYLDGTRNVVSNYRKQQHDIATTPLADNFRHVLATVEKVFGEQEEVLKQNESLDLEVQIEVLKTQLEREGVV